MGQVYVGFYVVKGKRAQGGGPPCLDILGVVFMLIVEEGKGKWGLCRRQAAKRGPAARPGDPPGATPECELRLTWKGRSAGRTAADGRRGKERGRAAEAAPADRREAGRRTATAGRSPGPATCPAPRAHQAERGPGSAAGRPHSKDPPKAEKKTGGPHPAKREARRERSELAGRWPEARRPIQFLSPFCAVVLREFNRLPTGRRCDVVQSCDKTRGTKGSFCAAGLMPDHGSER